MKSKSWILGFGIITFGLLATEVFAMVYVDPFFHYHKPRTDKFYYSLYNERSQNDGIARHFDYDALITGTSMTENFKTSEFDELFGMNAVKIPFSGGTFKEINRTVERAIESNKELEIIVRGIDVGYLLDDPNRIRDDLGEFPEYLYDDNLFNDVEYIFNNDLLADRVIPMISGARHNRETGITSFDDYANWQLGQSFGINTVCPNGFNCSEPREFCHISEQELLTLKQNLEQNVLEVAKDNPQIDFYYFLTPYSIAWWGNKYSSGDIYKWIEIEKYASEQMLQVDNIHLFMFSDDINLISDLNNYNDDRHYGEWVNSFILRCFKSNSFVLTKENFEERFAELENILVNYDYASIYNQIDYEDDYLAAEKMSNRQCITD